MKYVVCTALLLSTLFGCGSTPSKPAQPDGKARKTINSPAMTADYMARYYMAEAAKKEKNAKPKIYVTLSVAEVLEKYVPADFTVFTGDKVDLNTIIAYDDSRPWTESLGKPLDDAGIEMTANLSRKMMVLKVGVTTIARVLQRKVPQDFKAFVGEGVDVATPIQYDHSKPWIEALGPALSAVGVNVTANLDRKVVSLTVKQKQTDTKSKQLSSEGAVAGAEQKNSNVFKAN